MSQPTHPLLSLVESNRNGLKSMLTSYIDATVDSHYNAIKQNIVEMIQSGMIILQHSDVTTFGTTLQPVAQSNTDQSSAQCLSEYSNDTLTRAQKHQNNLQSEVSLSNTINTESMIKQEFDDGEEDEEGMDDGNVLKCEKGICNLARENNDNTLDDTDAGVNENVSVGDDIEIDIETNFDESQSQIAISVSNNSQMNNQNVENSVINERSVSERNMEQSTSSTSGARSSTRKQIQTKDFPANVDEWYGIIPHDCKKLRCKKQGKCQLEIMGEISNKFFIIPQAFEIFKTLDHVQVQGWLSADEVIEFTVKDCNAAARHMSQSITKVIVGPNFERVKRLPDPGKLAEFCASIAKQFELLNKLYRELYEVNKSIEPSFGGVLYDKIIRRLGTLRQQVNQLTF